jgi:hypothetical protein
VVLADVQDASLPARTRSASTGRWLELPRLLQGAANRLVVGERRWPWPSQVQLLLDCLQQQQCVRRLQLHVAEQLNMVDAKHSAGVARMVVQLCSGLAARAPQQVTSLHLRLGFIKKKDLQRVSTAVLVSTGAQPAASHLLGRAP